MRESALRLLIIIGGVGCIFKVLVWALNRFGLAQTASGPVVRGNVIMRVASFVFEYWPVWVLALGLFLLGCLRYGSPRSWVSQIGPKALKGHEP